ncbi:ATP-dependent DNA helicase [Algivirga pacifica]
MSTTSILSLLPFVPTQEQAKALTLLQGFIDPSSKEQCFVLRGSAGTGKTSLMEALTVFLRQSNRAFELAAPTGKAAKILGQKTHWEAHTLHSLLFKIKEVKDKEGKVLYLQCLNKTDYSEIPTVYIVDEASMVSTRPQKDGQFHSDESLLQTLVDFVKKGHPGNKLLLVGDHYQLPPVNEDFSAALCALTMQQDYNMKTMSFQMTEVKRQGQDSYILRAATVLRQAMEQGKTQQEYIYRPCDTCDYTLKYYKQLFQQEGADKVIYIAWKNKTVFLLNQALRKQIFGPAVDLLMPGDQVMVQKTIFRNGANVPSGEIGRVVKVHARSDERIAGVHFADVTLAFNNSKGEEFHLTKKVNMSTLLSENGQLPYQQERAVYAERIKVNETLQKSNDKEDDEYLSAMQLRYAYAITCHKAQGSEWKHVFLYPEGPYDDTRLRWIYTAITRASEHLYSFR